jgi:nucleoside diphosphate kinase
MAKELAFVLINPYTISKSRTGGVIGRYMGRTDLNFVGARMYGPSQELTNEYADLVRNADVEHPDTNALLAAYIESNYAPNSETKRPHRAMLLLFEGENAVEKIWNATGSATLKGGGGETIRDTYGDYLLDLDGNVKYFEPAVLVAPTVERCNATIKLWAKYSKRDGGIIESATDVLVGDSVEKTLVMLKPDNFRYQSFRAGNIIDLLSCSGLRIVAIKRYSMTVSQAFAFYGPVREALQKKFRDIGLARACAAISREFGFEVSRDAMDSVCTALAPSFAEAQFNSIVQFMTGYTPDEVEPENRATAGKVSSVGLVYEGTDAISKIRTIIGPTDPSKAQPGSVRKEFGSNIMVNAIHASDSMENALREMAIVHVGEDSIIPKVTEYYGSVDAL